MTKGKIYLIPTNIGDGAVYDEMPMFNQSVIRELDYFIVENIRSARRFLSKAQAFFTFLCIFEFHLLLPFL